MKSLMIEESDMEIKTGDLIRKPYPFVGWTNDYIGFGGKHSTEEGWAGGCRKHFEDGPAVYEGGSRHNAA